MNGWYLFECSHSMVVWWWNLWKNKHHHWNLNCPLGSTSDRTREILPNEQRYWTTTTGQQQIGGNVINSRLGRMKLMNGMNGNEWGIKWNESEGINEEWSNRTSREEWNNTIECRNEQQQWTDQQQMNEFHRTTKWIRRMRTNEWNEENAQMNATNLWWAGKMKSNNGNGHRDNKWEGHLQVGESSNTKCIGNGNEQPNLKRNYIYEQTNNVTHGGSWNVT